MSESKGSHEGKALMKNMSWAHLLLKLTRNFTALTKLLRQHDNGRDLVIDSTMRGLATLRV